MKSGVTPGFALVLAMAASLTACKRESDNAVPVVVPDTWRHLVRTEGQEYPIPESWLATEQGRIAHSLRLPDPVPKSRHFRFDQVGEDGKPLTARQLAGAYFRHLCLTEAGEWTVRQVKDVDGLFFARPEGMPERGFLGGRYGPEAPWVERRFSLMADGLHERGIRFVSPPFSSYKFVEEPRRDVDWQKGIDTPYIRMFGYTTAVFVLPGQKVARLNERTPMQVRGIEVPSARYGYTWRGITRPRDREFSIAGAELIIYDLTSLEVLSVSRNFSIATVYANNPNRVAWTQSRLCGNGIDDFKPLAITEYARRVLLDTIP